MADETLNITVDDSGSTTKVTNNLVKMADSLDRTADAQDKVTSTAASTATALNTEADNVSKVTAETTKATTAVKGYIDAQGNYIRVVGSNKNVTQETISAQSALTSQLSATSIEAGRAAAGYGPLNSGLTASQAAAAASRASIAALTQGLAGSATSAQAAGVGLGQVGAAGNAAAVGLNNGRAAFQGVSGAASGIASAGQAAASGLSAAGSAAGSAAPAVAAVGTASRNAATAANDNGNAHRSLAAAFRQAGSAASSFGGIIAGLGLVVGAQQVISYADSYTQVQNRLRLITTDQTKLNEIMNTAYQIAQKTATPFNDVANLYGKISQNANQYRLSASDVAKVTESMSLAFQTSGASGVEAGRAITQFSQGLQKGKLEAQDFKSILESAPVVQNAMLAGLQRIGVTVNGSLTEALSKGTVTAKQMLDALIAINPVLNDYAAGALPTVASAMTRVTNAFEKYIGSANEGNSVTGNLISGLNLLAANMQTVVPIAIALGGLLAFGMIAGAVSSVLSLATAFVTLSAAMAANPAVLIALGAALAVGVPLWAKYGDQIKGAASNLVQQATAAGQAQQANAATAASAGQAGAAYASAQANLAAANAEVTRTKAAMDSAAAGTAAHTAAVKDNNNALSSATTAANAAEAARKALENQTQANTKAEKDYAAAMDHLHNENAYGEKLQTITDFLAKAKKAQEAWQKSLDDTLAPLTKSAQATNALTVAATGVSEALAKAAAAAQLGVSGFDQFGTEAAHAAANLQAVTGDAGLFTEEQLRTNSSLNQGQSAMSGATAALGQLGAAYRQAGNDAEFFAINSKSANTVSGQIGSDNTVYSPIGNAEAKPLSRFSPEITTFQKLGGGPGGSFGAQFHHPAGDLYGKYSPQAQSAYEAAIAAGQTDTIALAAADAIQQKVGDAYLQSQGIQTQAANNNTSAMSANTAALQANTAAASKSTDTTSLPDLLLPENTTITKSGFDANGHAGVGATVTQTTYGYGDPATSTQDAYAGANSAAQSPGFMYPGGAGVGMLDGGALAPGAMGNGWTRGGPIMDPANVNTSSPDLARGPAQDPIAALAAAIAAQNQRPNIRTPIVSIDIKSDDYGQFKRSQKQIAQDIGGRVTEALRA